MLGLFALYMCVNLLTSPDVHLATDVGGKAASLEAMRVRGDWNPDIGYWFEPSDPDGRFFPIEKTLHSENGRWVNTTSLTMLFAIKPLYDIGGGTLAALGAIIGALLCAAAAGALERRIDPSADGKLSFVLVGTSSSVVVYSSDLWEHTWGLGLMGFGAALTMDAVDNRSPARSALAAGVLFGVAATMRQEALVYGFVAGLVLIVAIVRRRSFKDSVVASVAMLAGTLTTLAAYTALEYQVLGGAARLQRSGATAGTSAAADFDQAARLNDIFTTTTNVFPSSHPLSHALGILAVGLAGFVIYQRLRGRAAVQVERLVLSFVALSIFVHAYFNDPLAALFISMPLALLGVVAGVENKSWLAVALGCAPLPLVLMTQFTGYHEFFWGARYLMTSGLLLACVGIALTRERHRRLLAVVVAASLAATAFAIPWTVNHFAEYEQDRTSIVELTAVDDVVVWSNSVFARDFGSTSIGRRWLSADTPEDREALAEVLLAENIDSFVLVLWEDHPGMDFPGFVKVDDRGELPNLPQRLETWAVAS